MAYLGGGRKDEATRIPSFVHKPEKLKWDVDLEDESLSFFPSCLFPPWKHGRTSTSSLRAIISNTVFFFSFLRPLKVVFINFLSILLSQTFDNKPSLCYFGEMLEILAETHDSPWRVSVIKMGAYFGLSLWSSAFLGDGHRTGMDWPVFFLMN